MLRIGILVVGLLVEVTALAQETVYEGTWVTTNRKLDGVMTCVVKERSEGEFQGRFSGVWQGVPFDYTVKFSGSPSELKGTATIDGADYTWTGAMGKDKSAWFRGNFGGNRYTGYFDLKEKVSVSKAGKQTIR